MSTRHGVVFAPEAEAQIVAIYDRIAVAASPAIARRFTEAIVARCESLDRMPRRGKPRDDLRPGLRTLSLRRRVMIAYAVEGKLVTILGVFYGGQDWEAMLAEEWSGE
ncbi:MAG: type II toxin-antitoxin system RelE/ParE family toxin [Hyphomonadaceae bacterium]